MTHDKLQYAHYLEYKKRQALIQYMNAKNKQEEDKWKHEYHEIRRELTRMGVYKDVN